MSKINITNGYEVIDTIDNKMTELNKHIVMVDVKYIDRLNECGIPFNQFQEEHYICSRGKKKKKFNQEQVNIIINDLGNGLSIRKCANKYKCSTKTIQNIKLKRY
ncbi:MAG: helix-turn-helix domain containing protein [Terrisporobacter sp.]